MELFAPFSGGILPDIPPAQAPTAPNSQLFMLFFSPHPHYSFAHCTFMQLFNVCPFAVVNK